MNDRKHGGDLTLHGMIHQVLQIIQHFVRRKFHWINLKGKDWKGMTVTLGSLKPKLYHFIVKWEMPCEGVIKCNTDGACRGNPGTGTYGFCLRNTVGDLIYAEAEKIGVTTNVEAEMKAIVEAVRYCVRVGIRKIVIESDSILMVKIINGIWKVPWEIAEWFNELKQTLRELEATTQHTFREGNKMADYIANLAFECDRRLSFNTFQQLPTMGKKSLMWERHKFLH